MAGLPRVYLRNYDSSDNTAYSTRTNMMDSSILFTIEECGFSAPAGKAFKEWNDARDGTGTSYQAGTIASTHESVYAIWESVDISISYAGSQIATMSSSGTKTLLTEGKYCEDDIVVQYTRYSPNLQSKQVSPTTSSQTVSPDSGYDGLSQVTVNAMPSGSARTPATTITANPTISVSASGKITASVSKTQNVTPSVTAGYVASGTSGTITVNGSGITWLTIYDREYRNVCRVTVSLTNPVNFDDAYSGPEIFSFNTGSDIGGIPSASGEITFTIEAEDSIELYVYGPSPYINSAKISCTGGITLTDYQSQGPLVFSVSASGTITVDGIDYNH